MNVTNHVELLHSNPHGRKVMIERGQQWNGYTHDPWRSETSGETSEIFGEWSGSSATFQPAGEDYGAFPGISPSSHPRTLIVIYLGDKRERDQNRQQ